MPAKKQSAKEKQIHVRLSPELHKRLRVKCAYEDLSIQQYIEKLLREGLAEYSTGQKDPDTDNKVR